MAAHLDLWKQQLGEVPESVWEQTELETLVLADNGLTSVSGRISRLRKLRMLDLGHNALAAAPASLSESLDFLYLHDNRLSSLPESLQLPRLRYLNISENRFDAFPSAVCSMTRLLELRATDNKIAMLPACIAQLASLRELHLRNNQLRTLPDAIGALRELRQIDLRGNPLRALPAAMLELPRLEKVDLRWVKTIEDAEVIQRLEANGCVVYV